MEPNNDTMPQISVLFLDREDERRKRFSDICGKRDRIKAYTADSIADGLAYVDDVDIIISTFSLKDGSGSEMFETLSKETNNPGYMLYTDKEDKEVLATIGELQFMLIKPSKIDLDQLVDELVALHDNRQFKSYPTVHDEKGRFFLAETIQPSASTLEDLNEMTETVKNEFGADKTYIELMKTSEQDFLATCGFDKDTSSREESICTHTLLHDGVYVIEDVQNDMRFQESDMVDEMDIGFYAGAVLKVDGYRIGTLCVVDSDPHEFTEQQIKTLREYADRVETMLEDTL